MEYLLDIYWILVCRILWDMYNYMGTCCVAPIRISIITLLEYFYLVYLSNYIHACIMLALDLESRRTVDYTT